MIETVESTLNVPNPEALAQKDSEDVEDDEEEGMQFTDRLDSYTFCYLRINVK